MEKFVAARCLTIPTNLNDLTCINITFNFGPLLKYLDHQFWSDLPSGVLCDSMCMEAFKSVELPSNVVSLDIVLNGLDWLDVGDKNVFIT